MNKSLPSTTCTCGNGEYQLADPDCSLHGTQADKYEETLSAVKDWLARFCVINNVLAIMVARYGYDDDGYYDEERVGIWNHEKYGPVLLIDRHFITPGWQARYWWDDSMMTEGLLEHCITYALTHHEESAECIEAGRQLGKAAEEK